jgi:hypothetical protein
VIAPTPRVLRITSVAGPGDAIFLKVEGRLVGEWVVVLESELEGALRTTSSVTLDLAAVEFANAQATQLLLAAQARGVRIVASSPLLTRLLAGAS